MVNFIIDYCNIVCFLFPHEEFMLSSDYIELIKANPDIATLFEAHRAQHAQVMKARELQARV